MRAYIYSLSDDSGIRYIGSTIRSPEAMLSNHLARCEYRKSPVNKWMAGLKINGFRPRLDTLLVCSGDDRLMYEAMITKRYRVDSDLLNIKDGSSTESVRLGMFSYG